MAAYSPSLVATRFGSFLKGMEAFIESQTVLKAATPAAAREISIKQAFHNPAANDMTRSETKYGPLVSFRGMQHAPLNELGVVFVFGMLAKELGFIVEAIGTSFPDCEAKRMDQGGQFWKRVMIEFEYASSNFLKHGHDIARCDLIVCWTHDWKDCPIEVLELSRIVQGQEADQPTPGPQ